MKKFELIEVKFGELFVKITQIGSGTMYFDSRAEYNYLIWQKVN